MALKRNEIRSADLLRALHVIAFAALVLLAACGAAEAQSRPGIIAPGEAAVTGFSGVLRPFQLLPGQEPEALTFIDPDGPSLRVMDIRRMQGPPADQLVGVRKPLTIGAKWIGQVFGVALDDADPPNIYAAATSAYGISLTAPGPDGQLQRVQAGGPGVAYMAGQWGPGGGPSSIWRIDGRTGAVSLFATAGDGVSAASFGGLAFEPVSKSFFVADRGTGLIHRVSRDGHVLNSYDHGVTGLSAVGLEPLPMADAKSTGNDSPDFDSARPETWGYAPSARRVFGLAVRDGRLYYAVADGLQVWSVGLGADGAAGADARIELAVPPATGPTEISKITFDEQGRMYLAERPEVTGAQDYEALSFPGVGRVLRYGLIGHTEQGQPIWQPEPDEFPIGFAGRFENANGGVAIGYRYDNGGNIDLSSCGGFVWATGEMLRHSDDPAVAKRLGPPEFFNINGLQGNPAWYMRSGLTQPWVSYFADYADAPPDPAARGHLGDITILRACGTKATEIQPPLKVVVPGVPLIPGPRPGRVPGPRDCLMRVCDPGQKIVCGAGEVWSLAAKACVTGCGPSEKLVNGKCCSAPDLRLGGACSSGGTGIALPQCGAGQTPLGNGKDCCDSVKVYAGEGGAKFCCPTALVNGKCAPDYHKPPELLCADCCAPGYVQVKGTCCIKSQATSTGLCCPSGQFPSKDGKSCQMLRRIPKLSLCCAGGYVPGGDGKCCATANITSTGQCCPTPVDPKDRSRCSEQAPTKATAPKKPTAPKTVTPVAPTPKLRRKCPSGEVRNAEGKCVKVEKRLQEPLPKITPPVRRVCPPGKTLNADGKCVKRRVLVCPPGTMPGPLGKRCLPVVRKPEIEAPPKLRRVTPPLVCPRGSVPNATGTRCLPTVR